MTAAGSQRWRRMLYAVLRLARREGLETRDVIEHVVTALRAIEWSERQVKAKEAQRTARKIRKVLGVAPDADVRMAQTQVRCVCGAPFAAHGYRVQCRAIGEKPETHLRGSPASPCRKFRLPPTR